MKYIIAIDPGKSGGIGVKTELLHYVLPMPATQGDVLTCLREIAKVAINAQRELIAYLEQVGGFCGNGQPGSAMFKFGEGFGFLKGCLQTLQIPIRLVKPRQWQKPLGLGTAASCKSKTVWKNKLKSCAQRLYPDLTVTLATADALLILDYAIRQEEGNGGQP